MLRLACKLTATNTTPLDILFVRWAPPSHRRVDIFRRPVGADRMAGDLAPCLQLLVLNYGKEYT